MGAKAFADIGRSIDPEHAFWDCVSIALATFGRDGYTGSIAEKCEFEVHVPPKGVDAKQFAHDLESNAWGQSFDLLKYDADAFAAAAKVHDDKWGPAVAIPGSDSGLWIFCGLASF